LKKKKKRKKKGKMAILLNLKTTSCHGARTHMLQAKNTQSWSTSSKVTGGYAKGCFLKGPKREKKGDFFGRVP
jgi:hypothetical protein